MVKKSILFVACLLSITLCALILATNVAHAETERVSWARILKDGVYLYSSADVNQPLFILEKSYYVQIVQDLNGVLQVEVIPDDNTEFIPIVGYVRQSDVSLCSTEPTSPYYPAVKVSVTGDSADLKLSPVPSSTSVLAVLNTQQMCYYGKRDNYGTTWYYVRYAGRFGYVEKSAISQPQVSLHPTPLPQTPASTTPSTPSDGEFDPTPGEKKSPASEILLIIFVVVLATGLMLALFLPGNLKKRNNIFEQDI